MHKVIVPGDRAALMSHGVRGFQQDLLITGIDGQDDQKVHPYAHLEGRYSFGNLRTQPSRLGLLTVLCRSAGRWASKDGHANA